VKLCALVSLYLVEKREKGGSERSKKEDGGSRRRVVG